jgi:hypothetical protein
MRSASDPDLLQRAKHVDCSTGMDRTLVNSGDFLGEAAILTPSVLRDDTDAVWPKHPNEEANRKESLCEEDSAPTPREARSFQTP